MFKINNICAADFRYWKKKSVCNSDNLKDQQFSAIKRTHMNFTRISYKAVHSRENHKTFHHERLNTS